MGFDLDRMYAELNGVQSYFKDEANPGWERVRSSGGTQDRDFEWSGQTVEREEFSAVVWTSSLDTEDREGMPDLVGDLALHVEEDGFLVRGDRVERKSDGQGFKVMKVDDLGGPAHSMGQVAHLERQKD